MARPLVIVESPAKAKTIARFLGESFDVRASVGHVADLPSKGLAVDVDNGFKPTYELTARGKDVVKELRAALKDASELYLATDEDREGEAISWHLLEELKPRVPVKRMVFHEITRSAIDEAVANPRDIDHGLVDAAETRRMLDRLYGYEVSPVLWRRINRGLSAGRVQSPTIRLIVDRERERIAFVAASYWDVDATFETAPTFTATLVGLDGRRVATGRDFGDRRRPDERRRRRRRAHGSRPGRRARRRRRSPCAMSTRRTTAAGRKAPFMTSTLQQEGGRKLRLSAQQVMRVAQGLYERGYITYMRTDSTALSDTAIAAARSQVTSLFGHEYLSPSPRKWEGKVKNAQEAHEAIRPAGDTFRTPAEVRERAQRPRAPPLRADLDADAGVADGRRAGQDGERQGRRTVGRRARRRVRRLGHHDHLPRLPPGLRRRRGRGQHGGGGRRRAILPALTVGDACPSAELEANGHSTSPPARYTEASLVKKLEELGIGRPSTWASIMQTILDRGYVWKKGQALVPTWTAFAVVNLMERHFDELVDYAFTARIEDDLDAIARNEVRKEAWLSGFYFGDDELPGLKRLVEENLDEIDAAEINTFSLGKDAAGEEIVVKPGRYGPYVKRGDETASVPEDLTPDELTLDRAEVLLAQPKGDVPIGMLDGLPVFVKTGRYGPYVQWGDADAPPPGESKPKMASLLKSQAPSPSASTTPCGCCRCPGSSAPTDDGVDVVAANGRYGPYVQKGKESRSLGIEEQLFTVTLARGAGSARPAPAVPRSGAGQAAAAGVRRRPGVSGRAGRRQGRVASGCTSPTARPTRRSVGATASRR